MPTIYQLKPAFQRLLRPLVATLVRAGATPNGITLAGVALSAAGGGLILARSTERWPLLVLPAMLLLRMALNALDGMMAREHGLASPLGAFLNELGDVVSDALLYLPLAAVPGVRPVLVVAAVTLGIVGEMTGVVAVTVGSGRRYDGPMGKSDRAFVFGALALALGLGVPGGVWVTVVLTAVSVLALATMINRVRSALKEAAE